MGFKGPRKMTIIIPGMSSDHHRVEVRPKNVRNAHLACSIGLFVISKESESLVERWKHNNMENLLELHNKTPVWNEGKDHTFCTHEYIYSYRNSIVCS